MVSPTLTWKQMIEIDPSLGNLVETARRCRTSDPARHLL